MVGYNWLPLRVCEEGPVSGLWKTVEIFTGDMILQYFATEAIPSDI